MKRYRLSAISASLMLFLSGCSPFDQPEPESADPGANAADRFDISAYKEKIESLKAIWTQPGHEDDLKTAVPALLRTADEGYAFVRLRSGARPVRRHEKGTPSGRALIDAIVAITLRG